MNIFNRLLTKRPEDMHYDKYRQVRIVQSKALKVYKKLGRELFIKKYGNSFQ